MMIADRSIVAETGVQRTPLFEAFELAVAVGVGRIHLKLENERPLGNFKVLGGTSAATQAIRRSAQGKASGVRLVCASDGNHGLAVAAAAGSAGACATVFLHSGVDDTRVERIRAVGAEVIIVAGTYDDAVNAAADAAHRGMGILVPDTSDDPEDAMVADVMRGYQVMCSEIADQLEAVGDTLTHIFVQCGVGGLAAALASGLEDCMRAGGLVVVVEPEAAACVSHALRTGRIERILGDLHTSAEMLSCGVASAPAMKVLWAKGARPITVSEKQLAQAVNRLEDAIAVQSTPSGAAGLAGLLATADDKPLRRSLGLDERSSVLLIVSEGR